ncbi:RusA family crossover junction endodeoxyribonuclease [Methylobacterium brachiatum]|uniref:RusA family crossover junction endodeoxyribonuclease n=1 Tax=Methylobacterium brachiatum TaxID=269660 RepID=UPI000EFCE8B6|nr:RusA family crossover junction endodeoxyribonuclease [Methylobacterium brachiatum]AYO85355.1 RusA family crossover junction endodeoxyribonuclease [Methylobacterium brachiatum]
MEATDLFSMQEAEAVSSVDSLSSLAVAVVRRVILGVDPGASGRKGTRLLAGQVWSDRWPGNIDCGGGVFRRPYEYRGGFRSHYFVEKRCTHCEAPHLQSKANAERSTNSFCSAPCRSSFVTAQHHGSRSLKQRPGGGSHVLIRDRTHPMAGRSGQVYEHTLVMEKEVGRPLTADERVHHINCLKGDNRPDNLFLCEDSSEHFRIHGSLNACVAQLIEAGALVFDREARCYRAVGQPALPLPILDFIIPGAPVPFARAGSFGKRRFTPRKQADQMVAVKHFAGSAMQGRDLLSGPVRLEVHATYIAPASWSKKRRSSADWRASGADWDNLGKLISDCLSGIVFNDDAQVSDGRVTKRYGDREEVRVVVTSLEAIEPLPVAAEVLR